MFVNILLFINTELKFTEVNQLFLSLEQKFQLKQQISIMLMKNQFWLETNV